MEMEERIDNFRQSLINYVVSIKGREYQFEGVSIHYFIGDVIKRNYERLSELILMKRRKGRGEKKNVCIKEDLNLLNMIFY